MSTLILRAMMIGIFVSLHNAALTGFFKNDQEFSHDFDCMLIRNEFQNSTVCNEKFYPPALSFCNITV